jgi:hypothetical protein
MLTSRTADAGATCSGMDVPANHHDIATACAKSDSISAAVVDIGELLGRGRLPRRRA